MIRGAYASISANVADPNPTNTQSADVANLLRGSAMRHSAIVASYSVPPAYQTPAVGVAVGSGVALAVGGTSMIYSIDKAVGIGLGVGHGVGVVGGKVVGIAIPPATGAVAIVGMGGAVAINPPINTTAPNMRASWLTGCMNKSVSLRIGYTSDPDDAGQES